MDNTKGIGKPKDTPFPKESFGSVKKGKNYFLGIGINDYSSGLSALHNAVRDVERVGQILQAKYDFDILHILTNAQATRSEILKQLRALQNLSKDDSLLIYYSGHGHLAPEDGYWIPVNADANDIHDYIPNAQLRGLIRAIPTRHTLLIADSCYSGSFFPESETRNMRGAADELEKYRSRWAFCSGRHDQKVSDGTAGTHSPFAEALITELERNNRPKVYIQELAIPVINRTAGKYRQTPKANLIFDCGDDGGQFVFSLKDFVPEQTEQPLSKFEELEKQLEELRNLIPQQTPQYNKPKIGIPNIIIPKSFDFKPEMVFVKGIKVFRFDEPEIYVNFSISKYLVTQAYWKAVMGNNPSHFKGDDRLPVESVSWDDCQEFIKKLNTKINKSYRLPTESEWIFAAKGGIESKNYKYSGSNWIDDVAWYAANSENTTHRVGTKKENELGIYDMSGNVWEWCSVKNNSVNNIENGNMAACGGSWNMDKEFCRVKLAKNSMPPIPFNSIGFRLAL